MAESSKRDPVAGPSAGPSRGTAFSSMTPAGKVGWIAKLIVCIFSFGFIFPNVMSD